jgi:hypothetical protein
MDKLRALFEAKMAELEAELEEQLRPAIEAMFNESSGSVIKGGLADYLERSVKAPRHGKRTKP